MSNSESIIQCYYSHCTSQRSSSYTIPTASEIGRATSITRHPTRSSKEEPIKHSKSKHEVSSCGTASIPAPTPTPIVPLLKIYRLAPTEMQELSNQQKDLQDKGFIRPSSSPCEAPVVSIGRKMPYLDKFVIVFIDDIMIYSESKEEHEVQLKLILELLKKVKLFRKFSKCEFWLQEDTGRTSEAFKDYNTPSEMLRGFDKQFKRKDDNRLYFVERIWVPAFGNTRTLIMDEAHATNNYGVLGEDYLKGTHSGD
ncbi:putative reverse transcriptase domain-containing protein [Tanacetum coccineum]